MWQWVTLAARSEVWRCAKYSNSNNVLFSAGVGKEASECLHPPPQVAGVFYQSNRDSNWSLLLPCVQLGILFFFNKWRYVIYMLVFFRTSCAISSILSESHMWGPTGTRFPSLLHNISTCAKHIDYLILMIADELNYFKNADWCSPLPLSVIDTLRWYCEVPSFCSSAVLD